MSTDPTTGPLFGDILRVKAALESLDTSAWSIRGGLDDLIAERDEWYEECWKAREERDRLKAEHADREPQRIHANKWTGLCADLDVDPSAPISEVRLLIEAVEAERDRMRQDLDRHHRTNSRIRALAKDIEEHNDRLLAENAALRAGQGHWPEGDDSPAGEQVPRVISAEEVEVGQLLAVWGHDEPTGHPIHTIGVVSRIHDGSVLFEGGGMWFELIEDAKDDDCTIVLLEDAPTSDGPPAPRLTVHALNTAPVGSKLERARFMPWRKRDDGKWVPDWQLGRNALTSEDLIADGWADATLTHPEGGRP